MHSIMTDHAKADREAFLRADKTFGTGMAGMYFGLIVGVIAGILFADWIHAQQKTVDIETMKAQIANCPGKVVLLPDATPDCRPDLFAPIKRTKK